MDGTYSNDRSLYHQTGKRVKRKNKKEAGNYAD
jgi:hypothetical protein